MCTQLSHFVFERPEQPSFANSAAQPPPGPGPGVGVPEQSSLTMLVVHPAA